MQEIVAALAEQQAELSGLLADLDNHQWAAPVPRCPGWTVADVVIHLCQTHEMAAGSIEDRYFAVVAPMTENLGPVTDIDDGVARMVERERQQGVDNGALRDRCNKSAERFLELAGAADPHKRVQWAVGMLSVHTLTATRLAETWIHTGDIADALGRDQPAAPREQHIARLAWRTLAYAFGRAGKELHGPVAFRLTGPDGAAWDFLPEGEPATRVTGDGHELCLVAGRRLSPAQTGLRAEGPDADDVLALVRTYA